MRWQLPRTLMGCMLMLPGSAAEYVVATHGSDTFGDPGHAWATVGAALAAATGDSAAIVVVGPGTFSLGPQPAALRSGLSLRGAGSGATTLVGRLRIGAATGAMTSHVGITGCTLLGTSSSNPLDRPARGIEIQRATDVALRDVQVRRFKHAGLRTRAVARVVVEESGFAQCTFNPYNSANPYPDAENTYDLQHPEVGGTEGSAIVLGDATDVALRFLTIDTTEFGGRGIGNGHNPTPDGDFDLQANSLQRIEIAHSSISVDRWHGWSTGGHHPPQFSIELMGWAGGGIRIHHCQVAQGLSIVPYTPLGAFAAGSVRVDHNHFDLVPTTATVYGYALETTVPFLEFDHNLVRNGSSTLANYSAASVDVPHLAIHHNVWVGLSYNALIRFGSSTSHLRFVHNTVYFTANQQTWVPVSIAGDDGGSTVRPAVDHLVTNNLFMSGPTVSSLRMGFRTGVEHNGYWHLLSGGEQATITPPAFLGDPGAFAAGAQPIPAFALATTSTARGAGRAIAPFSAASSGSADLGAVETAAPAWFVGPNRPPGVRILPAHPTATAGVDLPLQVTVTDDGATGMTSTVRVVVPADSHATVDQRDALHPIVRFPVSGSWVVQVTADDGDATTTVSLPIVISAIDGGSEPGVGVPPLLTAEAPGDETGHGCGAGMGIAAIAVLALGLLARRGSHAGSGFDRSARVSHRRRLPCRVD